MTEKENNRSNFLKDLVPSEWAKLLKNDLDSPWFEELSGSLETRLKTETVFPPAPMIFHALDLTPPEKVKVVILGQDPYHGPGQAHGLAFSVPNGVPQPPSLKNIFKELRSDLGYPIPPGGNLEPWAKQGVLLLNACLTVAERKPNSHQNLGWGKFTDAVIRSVDLNSPFTVFILWGSFAQSKIPLINKAKHKVITGLHPSPLSAHRGFFGQHYFSKANELLTQKGIEPINWDLNI